MKFLVAVVLLACASTATAGLFDFKKPVYTPPCTKGCKDSYNVCKDVVVEEQQCPKPVYKAPEPIYKKPFYGRKLSNYKPVYTPAPVAPCPTVKVTKQVCTPAPCTVTELVDKTTCQLVCDPKYSGRKLSNYKPVYTPAPVYVAPQPKCENKCTTVKVPVTKCLDQCVYDICPKPTYKPIFKPKPTPTPASSPAPTPSPMNKPKYNLEDIKNLVKDLTKKHD